MSKAVGKVPEATVPIEVVGGDLCGAKLRARVRDLEELGGRELVHIAAIDYPQRVAQLIVSPVKTGYWILRPTMERPEWELRFWMGKGR